MTTFIYQPKYKHLTELLPQLAAYREKIENFACPYPGNEVNDHILKFLLNELIYRNRLDPYKQENTLEYIKGLNLLEEVMQEDLEGRKNLYQNLLRKAEENLT